MLTQKRPKLLFAFSVLISAVFILGPLAPIAGASQLPPESGGGGGTTTGLDIDAKVYRINRMTLQMSNTYFYDSNTTDDKWNFKSIGLDCAAQIDFTKGTSSGEASTPDKWVLTYTTALESGSGCGVDNTKDLSTPSNWSERQYVVFAGGSSDGKIISVKPDSNVSFTKKGSYNGNTVYIQDNVDPYNCPLVIRKNNDWYLKPLEKKDKEDDVSNQIKALFDKELGVGDTACGPTDNDDLGIFSQFGLPESYYNAGHTKSHYGTTDFGFDGKAVAGANLGTVPSIAEAAGIALNGPLKGGGYTGSDGTDESGDIGDGPEETSCAVDGIGWIVCPVMNFMAKLNDEAFKFLQSFLSIRPALISDDNTVKAWSSFRDLANVAFVIAFMVIVYSQVTSAGVSNYGIKKLLPRIVVAAILVNISYYICALAVDLSNIVGSSAYSLLKDSIGVGGAGAATTGWESTMEGILKGAAIGIGVVLLLLAVASAPMALVAFGLIILILIARQAFVILLVVVSPLAFVAYLLPNTEDWFKKWWKAFVAVLMVYPIVGVVFGGSILASNIISGVKDGTDADLLQIIALGVLAVPLFAVPALLKGSLSAAGSVGAKLAGMADKAQGRAGKQFGRRAERYGNRAKAVGTGVRDGEGFKRVLGDSGSRRRRLLSKPFTMGVDNKEKDKYAEVAANAAARNYVAGRAAVDPGYARSLAGGRLTPGSKSLARDVESYAIQAKREEKQKDIKAAREKIAEKNRDDLLVRPEDGSPAHFDPSLSATDMAAHAAEIAARGPGRDFHRALNASAQIEDDDTRRLVQKALLDNKREDHFGLADEDLGDLAEGAYGRTVTRADGSVREGKTYEERLNERAGKKLGGEKLAGLKKHDIEKLAEMSEVPAGTEGALDDKAMQGLADSIADARSNEQVYSKLSAEAKAFHERILQQAAARNITAAAPPSTAAGAGSGPSGLVVPGDADFSQTGGGPTAP